MLVILCQGCKKRIANATEKGLVKLVRKGFNTLIHGREFNVVIDCPHCGEKNIVEAYNSKLKVDNSLVVDEEQYEKEKGLVSPDNEPKQ
jgi:hypothetical protein